MIFQSSLVIHVIFVVSNHKQANSKNIFFLFSLLSRFGRGFYSNDSMCVIPAEVTCMNSFFFLVNSNIRSLGLFVPRYYPLVIHFKFRFEIWFKR